jgi:CheY-like chemotaxis protein
MKNTLQHKKLVLYADDDPDDLDFVRESFVRYAGDIELTTFNDALELLEFLHMGNRDTVDPCLILLDINMPRINGKDALKILRDMKMYDDVPVVLFTTSKSPDDASYGKLYNAGFMTKPLNEKQMDVIVEKFLEHCKEKAE